jgi:colicin import membrane protein
VKAKRAAAPERPQPRPGSIGPMFLAVLVHAAFFSLIVLGVTWQSRPAPPVQAELWDKLPPAVKTAEPRTAEPEPAKTEPVKPTPPPPEPPEVKAEPPRPDPAIARKLEREKREAEKRERIERERVEKKKDEEAKKREQDEAAKKKREDEKRRQEEERRKADAEKARAAAAAAQKSEIDRYVDGIRAKIRGRANVPDTVTGNPEVQVLIRILPGGEVLDIKVTKRSGNPTYDTAIERAIRSAQPLPVPPADSELFPQFRDLTLNIRHER